MSQFMTIVEAAKNGSMQAEEGSGISVMSDSLIARQPAIEEPSNISPSEKASSSISVWSKVTCCHLPRGSVKRRSTYLTSLSLIAFRTSLAVFIIYPSLMINFCFARLGWLGALVSLKRLRPHRRRSLRCGYEWLPRSAIQISCHPRSGPFAPHCGSLRSPDEDSRPKRRLRSSPWAESRRHTQPPDKARYVPFAGRSLSLRGR